MNQSNRNLNNKQHLTFKPNQQNLLARFRQLSFHEDDYSVKEPTLKTNEANQLISQPPSPTSNNAVQSSRLHSDDQFLQFNDYRNQSNTLQQICPISKRFQLLYDILQNVEIKSKYLLPSNHIVRILQLFLFLHFYFTLIYIPICISFQLQDIFLVYLLIAKFLDIGLQLVSAPCRNGIFQHEFKNILINYLQTNFFCDLINIIVFIIIDLASDPNFHFLIEILYFLTTLRRMNDLYIYFQKSSILRERISQFFILILQLVIIINGLISIWKLYSQQEKQTYTEILFIIVQILSSNATIDQEQQQLYCSFEVISLFLNGFILVRLFDIFGKIKDEYELMDNINIDLRQKILSLPKIQSKISPDFIKTLPKITQQELKKYTLNKLFTSHFQKYSQSVIDKAIEDSIEVQTEPEEMIIFCNQVDDSSLYFIQKGEFRIVDAGNKQIHQLRKGETFGEISFYTQQARTATVQSIGYGVLIKIERSKFINNLLLQDKVQKQPDFQEYHQTIVDQIIHRKKLPFSCFHCQQKDHYLNHCPLLNYYLPQDQIIKRYNQQTIQKRKKYRRRLNRNESAYNIVQLPDSMIESLVQLNQCASWQIKSSSQLSSLNDLPYDDDMYNTTPTSLNGHQNPQTQIFKSDLFELPVKRKEQKNLTPSFQELQQGGFVASSLNAIQELSSEGHSSQEEKESWLIPQYFQQENYQFKSESQRRFSEQIKTDLQSPVEKQINKFNSLDSDRELQTLKNQLDSHKNISPSKPMPGAKIGKKVLNQPQNGQSFQTLGSPGQELSDFDIMAQFVTYCPQQNYSNVIESLKNLQC